jgi:hypothetical protein
MTTAFIDDTSLCGYLRQEYADVYLNRSKLPQPFFASIHSVKAIILGTDPSNPQNLDLEKVFGLETLTRHIFAQ